MTPTKAIRRILALELALNTSAVAQPLGNPSRRKNARCDSCRRNRPYRSMVWREYMPSATPGAKWTWWLCAECERRLGALRAAPVVGMIVRVGTRDVALDLEAARRTL